MSGQGLFGSVANAGGYGIANNSNPLQNNMGSIGQANQLAAQQQMMHQYNRALSPRWVIDGRVMGIEEFGREMFGDDTAELTFFLLKYQNIEKKEIN